MKNTQKGVVRVLGHIKTEVNEKINLRGIKKKEENQGGDSSMIRNWNKGD